MRIFWSIIAVVLLCGCGATRPKAVSRAYKYDHDVEARNVYVRAYGDGWVEGWRMAINGIPRDLISVSKDPRLRAADLDGYNDGVRAGLQASQKFAQEFMKRTHGR